MKLINTILFFTFLTIGFQACKNETSGSVSSTEDSKSAKFQNDSKVLEGTGAQDISATFQLDQTQVIQPGNVGFNFKTHNAFRVYVTALSTSNELDYDKNQMYVVIAEETIKETFFKVESFDTTGEQPTLSVTTIISTNTVPAYRPSFVVSAPKSLEGFPIFKVDGAEIPVFIVE